MAIIKATEAKYIDGYRIRLKFNDGKEKTIDFQSLLRGEVFEPLKDIQTFKSFKLNPFTIEWTNGADFAPSFLYQFNEIEQEKHTSI